MPNKHDLRDYISIVGLSSHMWTLQKSVKLCSIMTKRAGKPLKHCMLLVSVVVTLRTYICEGLLQVSCTTLATLTKQCHGNPLFLQDTASIVYQLGHALPY